MRPTEETSPELTVAVGGDGVRELEMTDQERQKHRESAFWWSAIALYRWRWLISGLTLLTAVASIIISLQLPLWYASTTRLLPPEGGDGGLSALIGDLSPLASSLVGGGGGDYTRYLAILQSRTTKERILEEFDLEQVYDTKDHPYPHEHAIEFLESNTSIDVDLQYDFLSIQVLDQDPDRAARIANAYVNILNERNEALALEGASSYRRYIEARNTEAELALDSARAEMQAFQERYGVVELPSMASGLMESLAAARAQAAQAEIEYRALLSEFGSENPQVQAAQEALNAAEQAEARLLGGKEAVMPVPIRDLPAVGSEYARIYQEVLIQQGLIEGIQPLLEQARFEEERERTAVQVLDPAVPAVRKAKPKRAYIVIAATVSAFVLAVLFALAIEGWQTQRVIWRERFAAARAR